MGRQLHCVKHAAALDFISYRHSIRIGNIRALVESGPFAGGSALPNYGVRARYRRPKRLGQERRGCLCIAGQGALHAGAI